MENGNQPINPINHSQDTYFGLTKREYFAAMAMQGLLANPNIARHNASNDEARHILFSKVCVQYADELLKKLENGN